MCMRVVEKIDVRFAPTWIRIQFLALIEPTLKQTSGITWNNMLVDIMFFYYVDVRRFFSFTFAFLF